MRANTQSCETVSARSADHFEDDPGGVDGSVYDRERGEQEKTLKDDYFFNYKCCQVYPGLSFLPRQPSFRRIGIGRLKITMV